MAMIFHDNDMKKEIMEKRLGGEGKGEYTSVIPEGELKDELKFFNKISLEPGASIGIHAHQGNYEIYYILEGEAEIHDDGEDVRVGAGSSNICADGKKHGIKNIGDSPLVFIACIVYENK